VTHSGLPKDCKYGRCTFIQPNWFNAPPNTNNPAEVVKYCMLRDHLQIFGFKSNFCSSYQTVAIMGIRVLPYSNSIWKRDRTTVITMS